MPAPRISLDSLPLETRQRLERQLASQRSFFALQSPTSQSSNLQKTTTQDYQNIKQPKKRTTTPTTPKTTRKKRTLTPDMAPSLVKSVTTSEDHAQLKIILAISPDSVPTHQQKGAFVGKDGRVHFFTKSHIAKAEKAFRLAMQPYASTSASWGDVPIELQIDLLFPYPSSTPKKHLHKIGPHISRPDCDNCAKGLIDSMTAAGFWHDDSLIATLIIRKRRTTQTPCIVVRIKNLQPQFDQLYKDTAEYDSPSLFSQDSASPPPAETNPLATL